MFPRFLFFRRALFHIFISAQGCFTFSSHNLRKNRFRTPAHDHRHSLMHNTRSQSAVYHHTKVMKQKSDCVQYQLESNGMTKLRCLEVGVSFCSGHKVKPRIHQIIQKKQFTSLDQPHAHIH
eukprot:UN08722